MSATQSETPPLLTRESSRIGANLISLVFSRILCLGLGLVQMGIIFRALGVDGTGQFGFALGYSSLFTVFATLGIQRLLVRDIARDPGIAWTYVWTALGVMAFLSACVVLMIAVSTAFIEANPVVRSAVLMASVSVIVIWALQSPFEALLMARERMVLLAGVNLVSGIVRLAGAYYVLRIAPTSVMAHAGIALGNAAGLALCIGAAAVAGGWQRPHFRLSLAFAQIRESSAFTLAMFLSLIYFKSDISILKWLAGESAAGIYTVVQRPMEPLLMIAGIWGTAVFPALCRFSVNAPEDYARLMKTSARLALLVAFPMAFGIAALAGPIILLLTGARASEFADSVLLLRVLCGIVPFFYLNGVAQEFLYSSHRNWYVVAAYACAAALSVTGNMLLIPAMGVYAVAAVAILTSLVVSAMFVYRMRAEYGAMGLPSLVAKTMIACSLMAGAAYALSGISLIAAIGVASVLYLAAQVALRTLTPEERRLVIAILKRREPDKSASA
jgi:O-antigen/teichoic acid export membrane protein